MGQVIAITPNLNVAESIIFAMINEAAENGWSCPVNIDLEMEAGFSSCSMGSKYVRGLERKGYVVVERSQKARRVKITATGKWTTWPTWHKAGATRMDRGAHDDSFLVGALVALGITVSDAEAKVGNLQDLNKLSKQLERCVELTARRISGVLTGLK